MKKNELTTVKNLDISQLKEKAKALKKEIADLTLDKNMKKLKDLKMISKKRKEAAQFLTIARQKEMLNKLESKIESEVAKEGGSKVVKAQKVKIKSKSKE